MKTGHLRVVEAGEGCHSDVLTLTARCARLVRQEGLSRESALAMIRSEDKRGRATKLAIEA